MEQPSKKVTAGLKSILPVLSALLESPNESDFQQLSKREMNQAYAAEAWIHKVAYAREIRRDRK